MSNMRTANKILVSRMVVIWLAAIVLYFVALADNSALCALAQWTGNFVPAVRQQFDKVTPMGHLVGCYFGLIALLLPFAVIFLLWRQDITARVREGVQRSGQGWKFILFNYLVGLPFVFLILLLMFIAPIDASDSPRLFGLVVIHSMTTSHIGLLLFGSLLAVAIALFLFVLVAFLLYPVYSLVQLTKVK